MNLPELITFVIALLCAVISAGSLARLGVLRRDWLYLLIAASLLWIAAIYVLVLAGRIPPEHYAVWVRPPAAFIFLSFAILIRGRRL